MSPSGGSDQLVRELRLALVMNGGVSLAVWMGGVTLELDRARRAYDFDAGEDVDAANEVTTPLYQELLRMLRQRLVVDVIAGASAGGINGALFAASIYAQRPLPDLRTTWLQIGDFKGLLRSASVPDPPSLLQGDHVALPQLVSKFEEILGAASRRDADEPVYLYVTATDLKGKPRTFYDTSGRPFLEAEHRRVFRFEYERPIESLPDPPPAPPSPTPDVFRFSDENAAELMAGAARGSSSFPVAFEPHLMKLGDGDEEGGRWLIDGGLLDNQPFNPVLDRIGTIPSTVPSKRVVGYIVPYVTDPAHEEPVAAVEESQADDEKPDPHDPPSALKVFGATGPLARDLPKLNSLDRMMRELRAGRQAGEAAHRLARADRHALSVAARELYRPYRATRFKAALGTFGYWLSDDFRPGDGAYGQEESIDPRQLTWATLESELGSEEDDPPDVPWLPPPIFPLPEDPWRWGLGPSERIAADALVVLKQRITENQPNPPEGLAGAAGEAGRLVRRIRALKLRVRDAFIAEQAQTPEERATQAYAAVDVVDDLSQEFSALQQTLDTVNQTLESLNFARVPDVQDLINAEVVRCAFDVDRPTIPTAFDFLHMSAGVRNGLGHAASTPELKLAGMNLKHFSGFLKRSWRANDWLWGRLDGVDHAMRALLELDYLCALLTRGTLTPTDLAKFAFPGNDKGRPALAEAWSRTLNWACQRTDLETKASRDLKATIDAVVKDHGEPFEQLRELLTVTAEAHRPREMRLALLDCCRSACAARVQLEILDEELEQVADAIAADERSGASRNTDGHDWVVRFQRAKPAKQDVRNERLDPSERVALFKSLELAREQPAGELASPLGMRLLSQGVAVGTAMITGERGGLPASVRLPLAVLRGLTLAVSNFIGVLTRTPVFGITWLVLTSVLIVWALVAPNTLLDAVLPALLAILVAGAWALLAILTNRLQVPIRGWRGWLEAAGVLVILVAPPLVAAFVFLGIPGLAPQSSRVVDWVCGHARADSVCADLLRWGGLVAVVAAVLALIALVLQVFRGLVNASRRWQRRAFFLYRVAIFVTAGLVAAAATYDRWSNIEDRRGLLLFVLLAGALTVMTAVASAWERLRARDP
jgi:predicted acylesterase/phospholipase RssA